MNWKGILESKPIIFINLLCGLLKGGIMKAFDTQLAMSIISQSTGGFSYDTLARALITNDKSEEPKVLLETCRAFCLSLEKEGILRRCQDCSSSQDEYFEYIPH